MKVIEHHFGLKFGPFVDRYEIALSCDRSVAIDAMMEGLSDLGISGFGKAYDGALIATFSSRHEIAFYFREGSLGVEDRFHSFVSFRLWPSWLRRRLPRLTASLTG